jgi:Hypothetical glycosyl hydrolase family 15
MIKAPSGFVALAFVAITAVLAGCGDDESSDDPMTTVSHNSGVITRPTAVAAPSTVHLKAPPSVSQPTTTSDPASVPSANKAAPAAPSAPASATWQARLVGKPHIFAVDYIQPNQLENAQNSEAAAAKYPLVITGQTYAAPNGMTTYLDRVRALNPNIVLISYLDPLLDSLPESAGPGYDALRSLENIESAYLHDTSGNRLYTSGKHAYFDPSSSYVRSAVLTAIKDVLAAYPFDGIFLDNYDVQNAMVLDTQGNQYHGAAGEVRDPADYAAKLAAMTSLAALIRAAWPNALIEANGSNAFPVLNGEMVEGSSQLSRIATQTAAIAGRVQPFVPLFMDIPISGATDPIIDSDMTQAQSHGAWYGASVTYQSVIWPAAFNP